MILFKVSIFLLLALSAGAEKKIELQDIEEDNLKSENAKDVDNTESRPQDGSGRLIPLEFLKSGLLRYFESAPTAQPRYVHQYDVTEQPERPPSLAAPKPKYGTPSTQQAMVGYLSNVPMQVYLVPQYYNGAQEQTANTHTEVIYPTNATPRVPNYQLQHETVQSQADYIQVPTYVTPTAKTYVQQYSQPVSFFTYTSQPTVVPQPTATPVVSYQVPLVQYQTAAVAGSPPKEYYQNTQYTQTNTVDEVQEHEDESPSTHTEVTYEKAPVQYTRFYPPRTSLRDGYRHSSITELPHPNPIILKSPPSHLSHIPKTLPLYRPLTKPVFASSNSIVPGGFSSRPSEAYGPPFKRRPTSLLDSYIPSHVQIEYMKRGFAKDPLEAYEALSSGRHLFQPHVAPRQYERGFLPNQMYHNAAGGITYGHHKRAPKLDKLPHK